MGNGQGGFEISDLRISKWGKGGDKRHLLGGLPYGSATEPVDWGSGGGRANAIYTIFPRGGAGGGAIWLIVSEISDEGGNTLYRGDRTTFGYSIRFNKRGQAPQGQLVDDPVVSCQAEKLLLNFVANVGVKLLNLCIFRDEFTTKSIGPA